MTKIAYVPCVQGAECSVPLAEHVSDSNRTLKITMGAVDREITSDGTKDVWVSSYYENQNPTFKVKAIGAGVTIYDLLFKSSKV